MRSLLTNTGAWKDEEGLSRHLKSNGASRVILTAPGSGTVKNIVAGINNDQIEPGDNIPQQRVARQTQSCRS